MNTNNLTYEEAIQQVELLIAQIENNEVSMDDLAEKIRLASEYLHFCKEKLHKVNEEIEKVLKETEEL